MPTFLIDTDVNPFPLTLPTGLGVASLQNAYDVGVSGDITVSAAGGPLSVMDAVASIGTLFQVQNNTGGTTYFAVSPTQVTQSIPLVFTGSATLKSQVADGAAAVGFHIGTTNTLVNANARIASFENPLGTEKLGILLTGQMITPDGGGIRTTGGLSRLIVSDAGGTALNYNSAGINVGTWIVVTRGWEWSHTALADTSPVLTTASSTYQSYTTGPTGARTVTLPTAASAGPGHVYVVMDSTGSCSVANTITVTPAIADSINGLGGGVGFVMNSAFKVVTFISNGNANTWTAY